MIKYTLILLTMISFLSSKSMKELPTVEKVDLKQYAGLWYEIARFPNSFEKGLECVTATYTLKDNGKVEVLNKGHVSDNKQKVKTAKGTARIPDTDFPGRLKVSFFWPFSGDYYIIALDENYQYALVGDPSRKYLWVLSKTKTLEPTIYNNLLDIAQKNGFDTKKLVMINQDCH